MKVGKLRLQLTPNPLADDAEFEFRPDEGSVEVRSRTAGVVARIRVDANHPLIVIDIESAEPLEAELALSPWRPVAPPAEKKEEGARELVLPPAVVVAPVGEGLLWYQRNQKSIWKSVLELQGLGDFAKANTDPLLNRTFGAMVSADGPITVSSSSVKIGQPRTQARFLISVLTQTTDDTAEQWMQAITRQHEQVAALDASLLWKEHREWWQRFWNRSWIRLQGFPEALQITQAYVWQRFMLACAGRGEYPIKFNGAIFTADWEVPNAKRPEPVDADYRRWGGAYWFENTRLLYWAMLGAGDYDEMQPLFRLYRAMLPLAEARSRIWYGHEGANFFETLHFFGTLKENDYGTKREGLTVDKVRNAYIARYWSSGLELSLMMLDTYERTGDQEFLRDTALPIVRAVLLFYDRHYPAEEGLLVIEPSQALEQFHHVRNPADVIGRGCRVCG